MFDLQSGITLAILALQSPFFTTKLVLSNGEGVLQI